MLRTQRQAKSKIHAAPGQKILRKQDSGGKLSEIQTKPFESHIEIHDPPFPLRILQDGGVGGGVGVPRFILGL
eukprot:11833587-Karenia_brevis.AAC.1